MRVITGTARGRKLRTLEGNDVRPTTDKVKEAIFSIIQFDIEGSTILDLFAGSGQLGIEALSRGAKSCVFVDNSRTSIEVVKENVAATGFQKQSRISNIESANFLKMSVDTFDIAFLDPPYEKGIIEASMPLLASKMSDRGIVVCEHEKGLVLPEEYGNLKKHKVYKYGKIEVTVYRSGNGDEEDE